MHNDKASLRALAQQALQSGVAIKKIGTGETALNLTPSEWAQRVRMTRDEAMALDILNAEHGDDGYAQFEREQQRAWAERFA
jgi:hypothetical protein